MARSLVLLALFGAGLFACIDEGPLPPPGYSPLAGTPTGVAPAPTAPAPPAKPGCKVTEACITAISGMVCMNPLLAVICKAAATRLLCQKGASREVLYEIAWEDAAQLESAGLASGLLAKCIPPTLYY